MQLTRAFQSAGSIARCVDHWYSGTCPRTSCPSRRYLSSTVPYRTLHDVEAASSAATNPLADNEGLPDSYESRQGLLRRSRLLSQRDDSAGRGEKPTKLTSVLADHHSAYTRIGARRKRDLGHIHPTALEHVSRRRRDATSTRKHRNRTVRLSRMFAIYVEAVTSDPYSSERNPAHLELRQSIEGESSRSTFVQSIDHSTGLVNSQTDSSESRNGIHPKVPTIQDLEAVRTIAMAQVEVVATEALHFLDSRGFTLKDFAVWNWILSGKTAMDAALRLELVRNTTYEATADLGPIPFFVVQRLLLRNDVSAEALSIFIRQIWQLLDPKDNTLTKQHRLRERISPGLDALTTMVVRLLRHTRRVWPAAITNIAELWVTHARKYRIPRSRLSFHYNRILALIAIPSDEFPYQALHHRQRAFFILYRKMIDPSLRLVLSREGYRAFIQIQLAHRKTASERNWALLKGPTWPPWKVDRTGMDADIEPESGISRATTVLRDAAARGYGPRAWEKAAGILAGTDTDRSPAIQTRSTVVPISSLKQQSPPEPAAVWIARVKATRTLREAWSCFLACKDQGAKTSLQLYEVMMEKVMYDERRRQNDHHKIDPAVPVRSMPGDGKEVSESDVSHNQAISTREPLPTVSSLSAHMKRQGVRPSGRLLGLLLTHAQTYQEGINFLRRSTLHDSVEEVLSDCQPGDRAARSEARVLLETLPDWLFAAYITFLCKSAETATVPGVGKACTTTRLKHLRQAFRLVATRLPMYRPPWNALLKLLSRHDSRVVVDKKSKLGMEVVKFERAKRLLDSMDSLNLEMDFTGFSHLCGIVINANATSSDEPCNFDSDPNVLQRLELVKTRFAHLVRPSSDMHRKPIAVARLSDYCCSDTRVTEAEYQINDGPASLPRLFQTPHPAHIHVYIRCLGHHCDGDGLAELTDWLAVFADEVLDEAKETANGTSMFRTCLTALRAFGGCESMADEQVQRYENSLECLRDVMHGRVDDWGGWPADNEVERYFNNHDF